MGPISGKYFCYWENISPMLNDFIAQATKPSRFGRPAPLQIDLTRRIGISTEVTTTASPPSRASKDALTDANISNGENTKAMDMAIPTNSTIHQSTSGKFTLAQNCR